MSWWVAFFYRLEMDVIFLRALSIVVIPYVCEAFWMTGCMCIRISSSLGCIDCGGSRCWMGLMSLNFLQTMTNSLYQSRIIFNHCHNTTIIFYWRNQLWNSWNQLEMHRTGVVMSPYATHVNRKCQNVISN